MATPTSRSSSSALARGSRPSAHAPSRSPNAPSRRRRKESRATLSSSMRRIASPVSRSEEHTSELQSHSDLVCRLLLEKKKKRIKDHKKRTKIRHKPQQLAVYSRP